MGKMFNYRVGILASIFVLLILVKAKVIREEYTIYFKGLGLAYHTYNKLRKTSQEFCTFVDSQKLFDMNGELEILLTLPTLLMLPILRIGEYHRMISV